MGISSEFIKKSNYSTYSNQNSSTLTIEKMTESINKCKQLLADNPLVRLGLDKGFDILSGDICILPMYMREILKDKTVGRVEYSRYVADIIFIKGDILNINYFQTMKGVDDETI